jgi:L-ascorbate metabolism protein UlaG (beta-lactamase superfamily)
MNLKMVYLKPNLVIEPLVDRWYAWSHLISPATAAMNVVERHLAIMDSYLLAPDIHASAVLNPKMRGGPFMDLGCIKTDEVSLLVEKINVERADLIAFAKAIKQLDKLLANEATGYGLQDMYRKIPEILRGYVELFYDRNNNPDFRIYESLLYKSKYYKKDAQSIALWLTNNDHRPFCLSTPRLDEPAVLHLNIPFNSPSIDLLAKMKRVPQSLESIMLALEVKPERQALFENFFTEEQPTEYIKYAGDKIRMRYFGHACILIETKDVSILIDPLISYYGYHSEIDRYTYEDLPEKIDYALITHNHQDHVLFETLLPLRHKIKKLIIPASATGALQDPDLLLMFNTIGFDNVIAIKEMHTVSFDDAVITALPFTGEHGDLNILTKACYLVKLGNFKLMFLADSRIVDTHLYKHVYEQVGDVDVIFLGMECDGAPLSWLYGPLMTKKISRDQDGSRRFAGSNCVEGMSLVDIFHPKEVYVYAMGQEPWIEFISSVKYTDESNPIIQSDRLVKECTNKGIVAERLYGEKELLYNIVSV